MYTRTHIKQGLMYAKSSLKIRFQKKQKGSADKVCQNILRQNWNGKYYMVSVNHYQEFWARDIGIVAESLIKLGHKEKLKKTMKYAMDKYARHGAITTTISRTHKAFSFPNLYSPDSTALVLYTLEKLKDQKILSYYDKFIQKEIDKYAKLTLKNGYVKPDRFSSMRDYAIQKSSCYNHCMSILIAKTAEKLKYAFPYTSKELTKKLEKYWTGSYYKNGLEDETCTGDANTFPYWVGAGKQFNKMFKTIQQKQLENPIPLAYTTKRQRMILAEHFVKGWQQRTIWPIMGLIFLRIVKQHNKKKAKEYEQKYKETIEKYGTLYEVYNKDLTPYKSLYYHADKGMIWAANYLHLRFVRANS